MKQNLVRQCLLPLAAITLCFLIADTPFADDTSETTQLIQKLYQTLAALREKRKERYSLAEKSKQRASLLQEEVNSLQTEKENLLAQHTSLKEESDRLRREKEVLSQKISKAENEFRQISETIKEACKKLTAQIDAGIPYKIDERKKVLSNFLENAGSDVAADVALLWQILMQEFETGFTSEIYPGIINLPDGRQKEGKYLRIGRIALAYLTDDSKECGLVVNRNGKSELTIELSTSQQTAIKEAFRIMERQCSPALVNFPVYVKISKQGGNR